MKNKYQSVGLNYELIVDKYPNLNEYEEIVNAYLSDPFFNEIEGMIMDEDYAMAKDASKGLYILAQELCLYPLYISLVDIYEDLDDEDGASALKHARELRDTYLRIKGVFNA